MIGDPSLVPRILIRVKQDPGPGLAETLSLFGFGLSGNTGN